MARYILIDNHSGYIFGDSADINGKIFDGTPCEVAQAIDESIGEYGRSYEESDPDNSTVSGYHVYRADIDGSEAVGNIHDGQDQEMIAAVERDCEYVTFVRYAR